MTKLEELNKLYDYQFNRIKTLKERIVSSKFDRMEKENFKSELAVVEHDILITGLGISSMENLENYIKSREEYYKQNPLREMTKNEIENGFEDDTSDEYRESEEATDLALSNLE